MKFSVVLVLVFSLFATAHAGNTGKLIGRCEMEKMKLEIFYTNRVEDNERIVEVVFIIPGQKRSKRDFYVQGWETIEGKSYFLIAASFGLALIDGKSTDSLVYAGGLPSEGIVCDNNLSAVLADFPNQFSMRY